MGSPVAAMSLIAKEVYLGLQKDLQTPGCYPPGPPSITPHRVRGASAPPGLLHTCLYSTSSGRCEIQLEHKSSTVPSA
eukprot:4340623-Pyramimonas_sp.AAC.1